MTERRDLQQITTHQHCRQYPLDGYLAMNICKMTARQISRIRDMSLSELRKQEYVSREEFAYITGRTFKATGNYLDRNEDLVYREYATPNAAYPVRELLGITAADERLVYDTIIRSLRSAAR